MVSHFGLVVSGSAFWSLLLGGSRKSFLDWVTDVRLKECVLSPSSVEGIINSPPRPSYTGLQLAWDVAGGHPLAAGKAQWAVCLAYMPSLINSYIHSPAENRIGNIDMVTSQSGDLAIFDRST